MKKHILLIFLGLIVAMASHAYSQDIDFKDKDDNKLLSNENVEISNLYPNPATQYALFDYIIESDTKVTITFRNVLGSEIKSYELSHSDNNLIVSLDKFSSGIYFYTLSLNDKKLVTKKFIVKK